MIGVLDCSFNGLIALKKLRQLYPDKDFIFLCDNLRGDLVSKSQKAIREITQENLHFFVKKNINTVLLTDFLAGLEIDFLRKKFPQLNLIDNFYPSLEKAIDLSRQKRIGLLLEKNIEKNYLLEKLNQLGKKVDIKISYCQLLAKLVESKWQKKPEAKMILKKRILPLKQENIDVLVLTSNYFSFFQQQFKKKMGKNCYLLEVLNSQIEKINFNSLQGNSKIKLFFTDFPKDLSEKIQYFLGEKRLAEEVL